MTTQKPKPTNVASSALAKFDDRKRGAKPNSNIKSKLRQSRSAESDGPTPLEGEHCTVYDLTGSMQITLPPHWKTLIGSTAYGECLEDLRSRSMTIVSREPGVVVYVRLSTTFNEQTEEFV